MKQKFVENIYKVRGNRIDHANKHDMKKVSTANRLAVGVVVEAHEPSHKA